MKVVVYGLTITSSWGNGHATTYRSLLRALSERGHTVVFVEKDVEWYRSNRDCPEPDCCRVELYSDWAAEHARLLNLANDADVVVIGSYFPDGIAAAEALFSRGRVPVLFYDIDTPITLTALRLRGHTEYLKSALIPEFAAYLSFTGGPALRELEERFGARRAIAFYCSVDASIYKPVPIREEFRCELSYLGTYAPDRQPGLMRLLNGAAEQMPASTLRVAGPQYPAEVAWAPNVQRTIHIPPGDHPAFYSSSRFTLNLTRADMIAAGYSPSVRLFEASACGTAILSDWWNGLDTLLTPGEEVLLPADADEVVAILRGLSEDQRTRLGRRARERILAEHTSQHRALEFERVVASL